MCHKNYYFDSWIVDVFAWFSIRTWMWIHVATTYIGMKNVGIDNSFRTMFYLEIVTIYVEIVLIAPSIFNRTAVVNPSSESPPYLS